MPRNGTNGTYSLPAGNPVVTGTVISSATQNSTMNDVAAAITQSLSKDGQTTPTANLPMGGFKHTGAADGTAASDYSTFGQLTTGTITMANKTLTAPVFNGTITGTYTLGGTPSIPAAGLTGTVALANGGTGASTAAAARTNLGLVIGADVQAYSANLADFASKSAPAGAVVGTTDTQTLSGKTFTGATTFSGALIATANAYNTPAALTDGATITPDFSVDNNFTVTLAGNRTLANPTNVNAGQSGVIFITQDATGGRTLAFGSNWKFPNGTAPTLTTTANAVDALVYSARSSSAISAVLIANV